MFGIDQRMGINSEIKPTFLFLFFSRIDLKIDHTIEGIDQISFGNEVET